MVIRLFLLFALSLWEKDEEMTADQLSSPSDLEDDPIAYIAVGVSNT